MEHISVTNTTGDIYVIPKIGCGEILHICNVQHKPADKFAWYMYLVYKS